MPRIRSSLLVVVAGLVVIGAVAVAPRFRERETAYVELLLNADEIRVAELDHRKKSDTFLACEEATPRAPEALDGKRVKWPDRSCFNRLPWRPDARVWGTYRVELSEDGKRFTVYAEMDHDGDGTPVRVVATESAQARRVTENGVY